MTNAIPDAIDFAYHVSADKLASQLDTIDKLDTKLGVLIAALAALATVFTSSSKSSALIALALLVPAATSAFGYASRGWANPPNPHRLASYANLGKQYMQEQALAVILKALTVNDGEIRKKARYFNVALWLTLVAVLFLVVASALLQKPS